MVYIGSQKAPTLYTNPEAVQVALGGILVGETFNEVPVIDMLTRILYPYMGPQFVAFYIDGQSTLLEVGDKIEQATVDFNWTTSHSSNVEEDTVNCNDITDSLSVFTGESDCGSIPVNLDEIRKITAESHQWVIDATDVRGTAFNRSFKVDWQWRIYYGESPLEVLTEGDVKALRINELAGSQNKVYNMDAGDYKWICYPKAMGLRDSFVDADTNFEVSMEDVIEVELTNDFSVTADYYCHRTYNTMGSDIKIKVS